MAYDYSQYGGVLVARQDKVLTITLNAPETLNAFTRPMQTSMSRIWDDVNDDPDVHVVVLTGAGRAFGSGANSRHEQKRCRFAPWRLQAPSTAFQTSGAAWP